MKEAYISKIPKLSERLLDTSLELRHYFKQKENFSIKISKQGYLQQRKRLNPEIFAYLDDEYLTDFYNFSEPKLWNGYLLLVIAGSKAEVPNSSENHRRYPSIDFIDFLKNKIFIPPIFQ